MAKTNVRGVLADIKAYRKTYILTAVSSFGGMLFGWDTGLIGGVLTMDAFQHSFGLNPKSKDFSNLQGNIVSVHQGGCFFGAMSSFYLSDKLKYSLIVGALGQCFAFLYIGAYSAVRPTSNGNLTGGGIFAIICVYLFVVFYSFGWGPIPFVLSSECSPNHVRSLIMAAALMTQWLFNFVIAKLTPIMLAKITYGTFLLFAGCCMCMALYAVFCVPETKNVPFESIHLLFEGNIVKGCVRDLVPKHSRARELKDRHLVGHYDDPEIQKVVAKSKLRGVQHVEEA